MSDACTDGTVSKKDNYGSKVQSIKRLVLVEDRRRSVRVEVLDVDQQQGVRILERQPQAARAVGERDVVQPGVDLGARLLAVDVHLVIEDLACVVSVEASVAHYGVLLYYCCYHHHYYSTITTSITSTTITPSFLLTPSKATTRLSARRSARP